MSMLFDYVVIGAGVGGYPAAISLAQKGFKVAIVEKNKVGGECTNYGCIPTKAMIREASLIYELRKRNIGFDYNSVYSDIVEKREKIVSEVRGGLEYVLDKNDVKVIQGEARLYTSMPSVEVTFSTGEKKIVEAKKILLAVGSYPVCPSNLVVDNDRILNSRSILNLRKPPVSITIIGGGAVGVEYAFVFSTLGSEVHLVEKSENVLPGMDDDVRLGVKRSLIKHGVKLHLNDQVNSITKNSNGVVVETLKTRIESEIALVAIGRKPATDKLGVENAGIKTDNKGFIIVNEYLETSNPHYFAVGDVIGHPMLAHKAIYQSLVAAENMAGKKIAFRKLIPFIVYSIPFAGGVGAVPSKDDVATGRVRIARFGYHGLAMAHIEDGVDGFLKIVYNDKHEVIGAHAIGPETDMIIAALTIAIEKKLTLEEIGEVIYPHPSMSEALRESVLIGLEKPIHTVVFRK
jgi:dihydrolipoamide dehydrogenase